MKTAEAALRQIYAEASNLFRIEDRACMHVAFGVETRPLPQEIKHLAQRSAYERILETIEAEMEDCGVLPYGKEEATS